MLSESGRKIHIVLKNGGSSSGIVGKQLQHFSTAQHMKQ